MEGKGKEQKEEEGMRIKKGKRYERRRKEKKVYEEIKKKLNEGERERGEEIRDSVITVMKEVIQKKRRNEGRQDGIGKEENERTKKEGREKEIKIQKRIKETRKTRK